MTDDLDRLDRELREYGERWRATVPPAPVPDISAFGRAGRDEHRLGGDDRVGPHRSPRLLIPAAAAAVTLVVLGISLMAGRSTDHGQPATHQTPAPTTSAEPGIVPWAPLDATHPDVPRVTIPASPDPAAAAAAPPCSGDDLRAASTVEAAGGTAVLYLTIRPASPEVSCRLQGHPNVEFLDQGQRVDIPTENTVDESTYRDPALVAPESVVTLTLYWGSEWCTDPVTNDRIRIPLTSGAIEVDGYGHSPYCNSTPGSGPTPVRIGTFQPQALRPAEVTSAFSSVDAELTTVNDPVPGEELRFVVTLTARRGDVPLDPCPDYSMVQQGSWDDYSVARFALNCAEGPYRDANGVPYLPEGVPVRFEMRLHLLGPDVEALKTTWSLEAPGGPDLAIPTRTDGS